MNAMREPAETARMCCDLLGWKLGEGDGVVVDVPGQPVVWVLGDGLVRVEKGSRQNWTVDLPTLMIAASVRHAEPVEWPCPECDGTGHWIDVGPFVDPVMVARARRESLAIVSHGHGLPDDLAHLPKDATVLLDGCKSCAKSVTEPRSFGFGKMRGTGLRVVSAPEAVLMAAPRRWTQTAPSRGLEGDAQLRYIARIRGARMLRAPEIDDRGHYFVTMVAPGHEGAREALRRLAEAWREHLPVLGDWEQERGLLDDHHSLEHQVSREPSAAMAWVNYWHMLGVCPVVPRPLAECPAVARWLLAWLEGPCPNTACGRGGAPPGWVRARESPRSGEPGVCTSCTSCGGMGAPIAHCVPAIRAHIAAAWEHETDKCADCKGDGRFGRLVTYAPCQRCAGLGRVRPDPSLLEVRP